MGMEKSGSSISACLPLQPAPRKMNEYLTSVHCIVDLLNLKSDIGLLYYFVIEMHLHGVH